MSAKKRILIITSTILLCLLLLFAFKNTFANRYLQYKIEKVQTKYALKIDYASFKVVGLNTLEVKGLKINEHLLQLGEANIKFIFFKMLFGRLALSSIYSKDLAICLVKTDSVNNFENLYKEAENAESYLKDWVSKKVNYKRETAKFFNLIFNFLPSEAHFVNTSVSYTNTNTNTNTKPDYSLLITSVDFRLSNKKYTGEICYVENNDTLKTTQTWHLEGILKHDKEQISSICYAIDSQNMQIPFVKYKWNADIQSDTFFFAWGNSTISISESKASKLALPNREIVEGNPSKKNDKLSLGGHLRIRGLRIYHPKIDQDPLYLANPQADFNLFIGENFIELDSSSLLSCNDFSFHLYMRAEKNEKWHILTQIDKTNFPAQDLFSALPPTLFSSLSGIETQGTLSYHFLLDIDFDHLDSLKLESKLSAKKFNILKFGNANLSKMSEAFLYTAYDYGLAVKSFEVSSASPYFTPLSEISPVLQTAVLQSEDGGFFHHQGFLPGAFEKALISNIEKGKFAKGGSTISMQLVKNVFLSRNKTIARKLEEMLIVWLIETQGLTSKERMFEVYLNIIEWGPGIYGVGEACKYYFGKTPAQVNTQEAIFLSSIIPAPKRALQMFDEEGNLRPYISGHYRIVTERLKIKGAISEAEALGIKPEVTLRKELQNTF